MKIAAGLQGQLLIGGDELLAQSYASTSGGYTFSFIEAGAGLTE